MDAYHPATASTSTEMQHWTRQSYQACV